jgi:hypothetical protein
MVDLLPPGHRPIEENEHGAVDGDSVAVQAHARVVPAAAVVAAVRPGPGPAPVIAHDDTLHDPVEHDTRPTVGQAV